MSSEKWSTRNPKADAVRGDRGLILDSADSNNNKLMNVEDFSRLQSATKDYSNTLTYKIGDFTLFNGTLYRNTTAVTVAEEFDPLKWIDVSGALNVVNVRADADLPDAKTGTITGITDNGSGQPRFAVTSHGYTQSQTVKIETPTQPLYEGFHIIKVIDANTFDIVTLTFSTNVTGTVTRCLAADTSYVLYKSVTTSLGYLLVDSTRNTIVGVGNSVNKIFINGTGQTLFTCNKLGSMTLFRMDCTDSTGQSNTLFNIKGDGTYLGNSILIVDAITFFNFLDLGVTDEMVVLAFGTLFAVFTHGLKLQNTQMDSTGCNTFVFAPTSFLDVKNIKPNLPGIIVNSQRATIGAGASFFNISPLLDSTNSVVTTNGDGDIFGDYFAPALPLATLPANGTITQYQAVAGDTVRATIGAHSLVVGESITISGTTNYNGTFVIVATGANTIDFDIPGGFVADDATGIWVKANLITAFADGGTDTVTVTSAVHNRVNGETLEITGTVNFNGAFVISGVTANTFDIAIPGTFAGVENVGSWTKKYVISNIVNGGAQNLTATSKTNNGFGNVRIVVTSLPADITDGSTMRVTLGIYAGDYVAYNVNIAENRFDIGAIYTADEAAFPSVEEHHLRLTIINHGIAAGDAGRAFNIKDTSLYNGGSVVHGTISVDTVDVSGFFTSSETRGEIIFGSIDGTDPKVLVDTVSGQLPSKIKGAIDVVGNTALTTFAANNQWTDLVLGTAGNAAVLSNSNERCILVDEITGEIEIISEEPFSGLLIATMSVFSSAGTLDFRFRAVKNGGRMIDGAETRLSLSGAALSITLMVSVNGVKGDRFRLQSLREDGGSNITVSYMTKVMQ